jgi:hypothetical protein
MIDHLDNLLRHLFMRRIAELTNENQIRFQPPDQDWRTHVGTLHGNALNVYLLSLSENLKLRSNERLRDVQSGEVRETPAPRRLDCHYLITAWSPASVSPMIEPTVDEHALLYKVTATLANAEPLIPRRVYDPNPLPASFPAAIADAELPTLVMAPEVSPRMGEFWSTVDFRWKPGVHLVVTLPLLLEAQVTGPMVTTSITEYRQSGSAEPAEVWIRIGGTVVTGTPPKPVAGAWVRLETPGGTPLETVTAGDEGRFIFDALGAGPYTLRVRAAGFTEATKNIQVPSAAGGYDVELS